MGKAKRFNIYDGPVAEQRKVVQSYGEQRQNKSIGSSFRSLPLNPISQITNDIEGLGTGKFVTVSLAADQTTNIAATDHVEWDTIDEDGGIVLQTGAGQSDGIFELESGLKYQLSAHLRPEFSGATGQLVIAWYDITNGAEIGRRAIYEAQTHASHNANQPVAEAIVTPATNITVEVRIIAVTALTALANEYCVANIFEIALGGSGGGGGGGGSGGVSFPITPTINDHGNVGTVTEDLDLSASTGHIHKITLTGNPTLTFSNPPSSGTQMEFEVEFVQDGTGGRTVTYPASVVETVKISLVADTTTIITFRTNDGGTVYHAIPALRGTINLSGSSNFANTALSNLVSPTLNTDLSFNSQDATSVDRIRFVSSAGSASSAGDPSIFLDGSSNMVYNIASTKAHILKIQETEEYKFTSSALEMNANQITESGAILPDADATYDLGSALKSWDTLHIGLIDIADVNSAPNTASLNSIRTETSSMSFNLDTATHSYKFYWNGTNNFQLGQTSISTALNFILGDGSTGGVLTLNDTSANPSSAGQFQRNGADVKVFTGGAVVNLTDIGSSANATTELDNLGTTAVNASIVPDSDGVHDLGSSANTWDSTNTDYVRFRNDVSAPSSSQSHKISTGTVGMHFNVNNSADKFVFYFDGSSEVSLEPTGITVNNRIIVGDGTSGQGFISLSDATSIISPANGYMYREGSDIKLYSNAVERNVSQFPEINKTQTWSAVQTHTANILSSGGTHDIGNSSTGQFNSLYLDNTLFCSNLKVWTGDSDINVFDDFDMQTGATIDFADTASTPGGAALGAIVIRVGGTQRLVKFYST